MMAAQKVWLNWPRDLNREFFIRSLRRGSVAEPGPGFNKQRARDRASAGIGDNKESGPTWARIPCFSRSRAPAIARSFASRPPEGECGFAAVGVVEFEQG